MFDGDCLGLDDFKLTILVITVPVVTVDLFTVLDGHGAAETRGHVGNVQDVHFGWSNHFRRFHRHDDDLEGFLALGFTGDVAQFIAFPHSSGSLLEIIIDPFRLQFQLLDDRFLEREQSIGSVLGVFRGLLVVSRFLEMWKRLLKVTEDVRTPQKVFEVGQP